MVQTSFWSVVILEGRSYRLSNVHRRYVTLTYGPGNLYLVPERQGMVMGRKSNCRGPDLCRGYLIDCLMPHPLEIASSSGSG